MEKITKNQLKEKYNFIWGVFTPQAKFVEIILQGVEPKYCNKGKNGINWVVYEIAADTCIIAGKNQRIGECVNYVFWRYYAEAISFYNRMYSRRDVERMRLEFVSEVKKSKAAGGKIEDKFFKKEELKEIEELRKR